MSQDAWVLVFPTATLLLPDPPPEDLAAPQRLRPGYLWQDPAHPYAQREATFALLREGLARATQGACDRHAHAGSN